MRKIRKWLAVVLAGAMMLSITACGSSSSSDDSSSSDTTEETTEEASEGEEDSSESSDGTLEGVNLNIWIAGSGDTQNDETYRNIFDSWIEENSPDSTYELTWVSWSEITTKLSVALASGEGPDVFMTGYGMFGSFQAQGYMLNLSEYIPDDWDGWDDIGENFLEAGYVDGSLYGLLEPATRLLMYRTDIAEQNGVTEEDLQVDSLDDVINLAKKMACYDDSGNLTMSGLELMTTASGPNSQEQIYSFVSRNINPDLGLWDDEGYALFAEESGIETFEWIKALYDEGVSFPSESGDTTSGIVSGLASMVITTESMYATANATYEGCIGIVPCSLNTLLIGNFMCVNSETAYPEQAVDLVLYMFNSDSCMKKAEGLGSYSVRTSLVDWYIESFPEMAAVPEYYEHSYAFSSTAISYYNEGISLFRDAAEQIMSTGADIEETLTATAEAWNALKTD